MFIKSIHLDGFKSYQKPTDITGFSNQFNAITGYNGSGKSNVLDSICFVLGINKLDNIRAKSMAELISHGMSKASVQIRFDNTDKDRSPHGMKELDEVVVQRFITVNSCGKGCQTSYTLNGHLSTNGKIQDFFRGMGLNVNNPHFLIMQGRITTVLNMKPEEILGMIEEAAGTKMYDQKKSEAQKTLRTKKEKLHEIDLIISNNITPRMDKFREDRKNMVEVTRLNKLKENSMRKLEAYNYYQSLEHAKRDAESIKKVEEEVENLEKKVEETHQELLRKEQEKVELDNALGNKDVENGLSKIHSEKSAKVTQLDTERSQIVNNIDKLKKDQDRIKSALGKDRSVLKKRLDELEGIRSRNEQEINQHKEDEELVTKYRNDLESLTRGTVANAEGQHVSIEQEIQECRSKSAGLEAAMKTASNRRERILPRIAKLSADIDRYAAQNSSEINDIKNLENQIQTLSDEIAALNFDAETDGKLRERVSYLKNQIRDLEEENRVLCNRVGGGRYALNYTPPPVANFDAKRDILGYIVHLTKMKPGTEKYGIAIETAMAGMYNQIVVRDQDVARILIDAKAFSGRRTMIPVSENQRNSNARSSLSDRGFAIAKKKAAEFNETVVRMIDLLDYPECINNTYLNTFAHILVVESIDCARAIAYLDGVNSRTITLRGDDVKPNGVMTGGYNESGNQSTLLAFAPMHKNLEKIAEYEKELAGLEAKLKINEIPARKYHDLKNRLSAAEKRLHQVQQNVANSDLGLRQTDISEARKELQTVEADIESNSKLLSELQEKVKTLETMKNNDKNSQEKRKKELTAMLQKAEKNACQNKDKAEKAKRAVMETTAAVEDLESKIKVLETEWETKKKETDDLEEKLPAAEAAHAEAKAEAQAVLDQLNEAKSNYRQVSTRITKTGKECEMLRREEGRIKTKKEEREKEVVRLVESEKAYQKHATALLNKFEWLADEQVHFNKKGGIYDFEGFSGSKGAAEVEELTAKIEKLERSLCMKNVSNLDTCEAKVMDIKNKRTQLDSDLAILTQTITVLDKRKVDELKRAHASVDEDFGKIFSCLLPDAFAQLVPPEGKNVCQGLEVKVSFNGVVKDSLHELSGGQRSLVALSLILAMLKFKPAPLYILDEVDAALDLSHTANIGMMIKSHFQSSQFIIVSLKQGMFSNADVLFQTHFADGHSTCERLSGAELEKAKNDMKLAKQAQEMTNEATESKKSKKAAPKSASSSKNTET